MTYFKYFPTIDYKFGENMDTSPFQNISLYSTILDQIEDESSAYRLVQIRDGERPDVLSQRLYDTVDFHWTFYLLNGKLRDQGWPLSQQDLLTKIAEDIPGDCIVFFGESTNATNGNVQHCTVGEFPIGSNIFGSVSGASGVVYAKNPLLGQIFIRRTNSIAFQANESVVDTLSVSPTYRIDPDASIIHSPAYNAIRSVEDGTGKNIDVDYSADFRSVSDAGVFDDPDNRNIYATDNPYSTTTFYEHYVNENDDLSRIKVLVPAVANQVNKLLRESLNNG